MDKILTFALDESRFLSNFYPYRDGGGFYPHPVKVVYDGMAFDCVECAYQAAKTLDMEMRAEIQAMTPFEAKKLEKIQQISQWVIDRIIWLEEGKIIFEKF